MKQYVILYRTKDAYAMELRTIGDKITNRSTKVFETSNEALNYLTGEVVPYWGTELYDYYLSEINNGTGLKKYVEPDHSGGWK